MTNILDLIIAVAMVIMVVLIIYGFRLMTKEINKEPKAKQEAFRASVHNRVLIGIRLVKELAHTEVINVARDSNLPSGSAKKNQAVEDINNYLSDFDFHIPEVVIARIVEATYQTLEDFLKKEQVDSRVKSTGNPTKMTQDELNKRLP